MLRFVAVDENKLIEKLVLTSIDTANAMLDEYAMVVPFGIRAFKDSDDLKMNCPCDKHPDAQWLEQIDLVVTELKGFVQIENIFATAIITELQSDDESAIGLQLETELSSVMFVYPFEQQNENWVISEPIKTEQLLTRVFNNNQ